MSKLTLSVDERVVQRAKRYAERRHTSVSRLVEVFLGLLSGPGKQGDAPPILRRLRGSLRGVDAAGYRRYLNHKYR